MGRDVVVFKFDVVSIRAPPWVAIRMAAPGGRHSSLAFVQQQTSTVSLDSTLPSDEPSVAHSFNPRAPGGARFEILGAVSFQGLCRFNPRAPGGARFH